jgi:hypothetical protein
MDSLQSVSRANFGVLANKSRKKLGIITDSTCVRTVHATSVDCPALVCFGAEQIPQNRHGFKMAYINKSYKNLGAGVVGVLDLAHCFISQLFRIIDD